MNIGKIPNDVLKSLILGKIKNKRDEILVRPGIGEDCSIIDFGNYACVISSDPITGTANEIGRLAVQVTCNDLASCGVEPLGLMVTLLAPPGTSENELEIIMEQLSTSADSINVDIIGGHTEITSAVNRFVISATAIGRAVKDGYVTTKGVKPYDDIVISKSAGLEGTAIIAFEKENELLDIIGEELLYEAKGFIENISVVKEGLIAAKFGVSAMHDVTEGGLMGAVWELCEASDAGVEIFKENIPVAKSTRSICEYYEIDPLKLISSGCMLMASKDGEGLVRELNAAGISAAKIGRIVEGKERYLVSKTEKYIIQQPESDELYRIIDNS